NFLGTLEVPYNGDSLVAGSFTLDTTGPGSITAFSFITPVGTMDASHNFTPHLNIYTPASSPAADFVNLTLLDHNFDSVSLWFETDLSSFSGSTFFTGGVAPVPGGSSASSLVCSPLGTGLCAGLFSTHFIAGSGTPAAAAVPEPSPSFLIGLGFLAIAALFSRRRARFLPIFGFCVASAGLARADNVQSFNFSGTLTNGNAAVTGSFTLDETLGITDFSFVTPVATITPGGGWTSMLFIPIWATSPATSLLGLQFVN